MHFPENYNKFSMLLQTELKERADIQDKEYTVKEIDSFEKNYIKNIYMLQIPVTYKIFFPKTSDYHVPQLSKSCCLLLFVRWDL